MKFLLSVLILFFVLSNSYSQDSLNTIYQEAVKEAESKNYEKAISLYSKYLAIRNMHEEVFFERGNVYYDMGKFENAIADYQTSAKLGNKNPDVYYNMGMSYLNLTDYKNALASQEKVIQLDTSYTDAYIRIGDLYVLMQEHNKAIPFFNKSLSKDSSRTEVLIKLASIYSEQKAYSTAAEFYNSAISKDNKNPLYYYLASEAYMNLNDTANAVKYLNTAISIDPNYAQAYHSLASYYFKTGVLQSALENYDKAISLKQSGLSPSVLHTERGMVYKGLKEFDKAINDFDFSLKLNDKDTLAYIEMAEIHIWKNEDSLGFIDLNKGLALDKDNVKGLIYRGIFFMNISQYDVATKDLTRAVELAPRDTLALFALGNLYLAQEKYQDAIRYYDKALKENNNYVAIYENRGIAYYNLGFYRQAMSDFDNAMKHNSSLVEKLKPLYQDAKLKAGM